MHMDYLKLELTSFVENQGILLQNNTFNYDRANNIFSIFPVQNDK